MKRPIAVLLLLLICLGLTACTGGKDIPESHMYMVAVSDRSATLYTKDESASFEVSAKDVLGEVKYEWHACDEKGTPSGELLCTGPKYTVTNIGDEDAGTTRYYLCTAQDQGAKTGLIFRLQRERRYFAEEHRGVWTNLKNGRFYQFGSDNSRNNFFFAVWNAGGMFPAGTIEKEEKVNGSEWHLLLVVPEKDYLDEGGEKCHSDAYSVRLIAYDQDELNLKIVEADDNWKEKTGEFSFDEPGVFTKDPRYQYPDPEPFEIEGEG